MTLRQKTLAIILATMVGLLVLLYVGYSATVLRGFELLEQQDAGVNVERVLAYLASQTRNLSLQIKDWAHWDDTYQFIQGDYPTFPDDNLDNSTFDNLRLNLMAFVDNDRRIVFGKAYDIQTGEVTLLSENTQGYLDANPLLLSRPGRPTDGVAGLLVISETPVLVASSPILKSDLDGPPAGTLVWARYMTEPLIEQLSDFIQAPVVLQRLNAPSMPDDFAAAATTLSVQNPITTRVLDPTTIAAYGLLTDLYGQPALILRLTLERAIFEQGQLTLSWFALSLAGAGLVFAVLFMLLLERLILARLARMSKAVEGIGVNGNVTRRVPETGNDELSKLAHAINASLAGAAESQERLRTLNQELEQRVAGRTADLERELLFQEAILDSMNEGVLYGSEDAIEYANQMMAELSAYDTAELIGQPQSMLFSAPTRLERRRMFGGDATSDDLVQVGERKLRRKDGKLVDVAFTVAPLLDESGVTKYVSIIRDITEEKALQARRDRFLANASHELRTPLTNLITRLYLLRRQPDLFENHLDVLDKVAAHMKNLVEDLLDVSRFSKGTLSLKRERLKLAPLIREVVDLQRHEAERKRLSLTMDLPEDDVLVFVDRKRFHQVLTNLVFNAINYTLPGGKVEIRLTTETTGSGGFALLCVADTGVGIEPESLDQIFQPFFRASQEVPGTGLGLSIVKEIVTQHGGAITVESAVGSGTTFFVRIAMIRPDAEPEGN